MEKLNQKNKAKSSAALQTSAEDKDSKNLLLKEKLDDEAAGMEVETGW